MGFIGPVNRALQDLFVSHFRLPMASPPLTEQVLSLYTVIRKIRASRLSIQERQ
jgi:hypothetical protein